MSGQAPSATRVRITIGDRSIEATLADSDAARDFASLLPITLADERSISAREVCHLPRAISEQGKRTYDYAVGTIGYWPPGPDVAIFYRQDGERIPRSRPDRPRQDQGGRGSSQCAGRHPTRLSSCRERGSWRIEK